MASGQPRQVLRPSVLERLVGDSSTSNPHEDLTIGIRELKREVLRDLQLLLNTRGGVAPEASGFKLVQDSIVNYGIPDLSKMTTDSDDDKKQLRELLADVIGRFEPRLKPLPDCKSITVELDETQKDELSGDDPVDPVARIRFRIDAVLHVEPIRDVITFHTDIETETNAIDVPEAKEVDDDSTERTDSAHDSDENEEEDSSEAGQ